MTWDLIRLQQLKNPANIRSLATAQMRCGSSRGAHNGIFSIKTSSITFLESRTSPSLLSERPFEMMTIFFCTISSLPFASSAPRTNFELENFRKIVLISSSSCRISTPQFTIIAASTEAFLVPTQWNRAPLSHCKHFLTVRSEDLLLSFDAASRWICTLRICWILHFRSHYSEVLTRRKFILGMVWFGGLELTSRPIIQQKFAIKEDSIIFGVRTNAHQRSTVKKFTREPSIISTPSTYPYWQGFNLPFTRPYVSC